MGTDDPIKLGLAEKKQKSGKLASERTNQKTCMNTKDW
jgi:hypothetical protein